MSITSIGSVTETLVTVTGRAAESVAELGFDLAHQVPLSLGGLAMAMLLSLRPCMLSLKRCCVVCRASSLP